MNTLITVNGIDINNLRLMFFFHDSVSCDFKSHYQMSQLSDEATIMRKEATITLNQFTF